MFDEWISDQEKLGKGHIQIYAFDRIINLDLVSILQTFWVSGGSENFQKMIFVMKAFLTSRRNLYFGTDLSSIIIFNSKKNNEYTECNLTCLIDFYLFLHNRQTSRWYSLFGIFTYCETVTLAVGFCFDSASTQTPKSQQQGCSDKKKSPTTSFVSSYPFFLVVFVIQNSLRE